MRLIHFGGIKKKMRWKSATLQVGISESMNAKCTVLSVVSFIDFVFIWLTHGDVSKLEFVCMPGFSLSVPRSAVAPVAADGRRRWDTATLVDQQRLEVSWEPPCTADYCTHELGARCQCKHSTLHMADDALLLIMKFILQMQNDMRHHRLALDHPGGVDA